MGEQQTNAQLASWLRVQSQLAADNGHDETAEALERAAQRLEGEISEAKVKAAVLSWCNSKRKRYGFEPLSAVTDELMRDYGDDIHAALEAARES